MPPGSPFSLPILTGQWTAGKHGSHDVDYSKLIQLPSGSENRSVCYYDEGHRHNNMAG
jgi:hypothetical protein